MVDPKKVGVLPSGRVGPDGEFELRSFDLVPIEWVEAMYPDPSPVGRIVLPKEAK